MSNPGESTGPLSIDQAVAAMELPKKEPEAPAEAAPAKEETDSPAAPTAEDATAETSDGETETKPEAEAEAEQPGLEPPKFWDADAKERFKALPPDVQEIIIRKEDERNAATSRAMQENAEKKKVYDTEASKFQQLAATLDKQIPQAIDGLKFAKDQYTAKWANVDWNAVVDQYGADQALKLKNQHDSEKAWLDDQSSRIQQLQAVKEQADRDNHQKFVAEEKSKLASLAPELTDPKQGQERLNKLGQFLVKEVQAAGGNPADLDKITAWQTALAYDAFKWRNGQQTAKALVNATPQAAPVRKAPAKPGATTAPGSTQSARIDTLSRKRELSVDEAVELANLKGNSS